MLFYSFFKSLVGKDVVVELKNDLSICGTLHSVDQYLNIKLTDISVTDPEKYPHMFPIGDPELDVLLRTRTPLPNT
ncbi:LSM2 homolog, U6 small nuclear RNA associated (S. cerevisiae), isoform CRA_f [Mus musculus]|nr:LSM2 homolog, U6 small nuclear RNA associated (S. cerevisiae), isoform CRA_f [Mus musculus]